MLWKPGDDIIKKGVYVYECPVCGNRARLDDAYGPACTGPHSSFDQHEMTPMKLLGTDTPRIIR